MTQMQIAILELVTVGGIGLVLIIAAVCLQILANRRNRSCTVQTPGVVTGYRFPGEGRMIPVVEFRAGDTTYQTKKKFNGIIAVKQPNPQNHRAYENEKGYLCLNVGLIVNARELAEELWPLHSEVAVYYSPRNPKINYVDRPTSNKVVSILFAAAGTVTFAIALVLFFVMQ